MADECLVCGGNYRPAFSRRFDWDELGSVAYERCESCGFVRSRTHAHMSPERWTALNRAFHQWRDPAAGRTGPDRWRRQIAGYGETIARAAGAGLLAGDRTWLDYGAGEGALADLVAARTGHRVLRYEPFMTTDHADAVDAAALPDGSCDLVVNTAMFEHVTDRRPLDDIARLVSADGTLALHTVVVERVPDDPDWFYLLPVHCAFFTNGAMDHLCRQWGFVAGVYHVPARMWLLSRRPLAAAGPAARDLLAAEDWVTADGWVAYWQG